MVILGFVLKWDYPEKLEIQLLPFLKKNLNTESKLIISGGHTDPHNPQETEAEIIWRFLTHHGIYANVFLETKAITSFQNILFLAKNSTLRLFFQQAERIIVIGEACSKKEILFLASRFWGTKNGKIEYYPLYLYPAETRTKKEKQKYLLAIIGYYFPPLYIALSLSRWWEKRKICWKMRHKFCHSPFSWGCDKCKF